MFKHAIVRKPTESMIRGIRSIDLGKPDYKKALIQHDHYCNALIKCGLEVKEIKQLPDYPDAVFVEDTAVVTEKCAVITRPGHLNRRGEEISVAEKLKDFRLIDNIVSPGTLDGGDIMCVEDHFYVGLSDRTNPEGFKQFKKILNKYGYTSSTVEVEDMLHLKSGINYVGNHTVVTIEPLANIQAFSTYQKILIPKAESYAANCVLINDYLLIAKGFPLAKNIYLKAGFNIIELDMSEYQKLDGGLSCLSLRF